MCKPLLISQNNIELVVYIVGLLNAEGMDVTVFGGWAEEMLHAIASREHRDIDLLLFAESFQKFDQFLAAESALVLCRHKHFPHKRAFFINGILVEVILVQSGFNGAYTRFFGTYTFFWPKTDFRTKCPIRRIPIATMTTIRRYRRRYRKVRAARSQHKIRK